jgi:cytochrome c biogenesis protein CcmG/thiol:disulfide interchange protein DsbE
VSVPRLVAALSTALVLGYFGIGCSPTPSVKAAQVKADKDRKEAPDFALKDADGKLVHLSDYRGKVVILDFWATWCGPCKIEIPWFMEMQRKDKDRGFEVVGVAMDDEGWEAVKPFAQKLGINYRLVMGNDQTAQMYGGVDALPTTFIIDRAGKIAAVHVGLASKKDFEDGVEALLNNTTPGIVRDDGAGRAAVPPVAGPK